MSINPGDQRLAGGYVEINVRGAEQAEAQVKKTTETVGRGMTRAATRTEAAGNRITGTLQRMNKGFDDSIGRVAALAGKLTILTAVAGTFYEVGRRIGETIFGKPEPLERFSEAMKRAGAATGGTVDQLEAINKAILTAQQTIDNFRAMGNLEKNLELAAQVVGNTEVEQALASLGGLLERRDALIAQRREEQAQEAVRSAREAQAAIERSRLSAEERAVQDAERHLAQIAAARERTTQESVRQELDQMRAFWEAYRAEQQAAHADRLRLIDEAAEAAKRAEREVIAERRQLLKDEQQGRIAAEKATQVAIAQALKDAMREAQREQAAFNQRTLVALEGVAASLDLQERRLAAINPRWGG